jgi:hypothetical protein
MDLLFLLEEKSQPPPGQEELDPETFLSILLPKEGYPLTPGYLSIPLSLPSGSTVVVNGKEYLLSQGRETVTVPVPSSVTEFTLTLFASHPGGLTTYLERRYPVEDPGPFVVGFLSGKYRLSRSLKGETEYRERKEILGEGRLYGEASLGEEGKVKFQVKTEEREVSRFKGVFRDIPGERVDRTDPFRSYPTYGDLSTTVEELPGGRPIGLDLSYRHQEVAIGTVEEKGSYSLLKGGTDRFYGGRIKLSTLPLISPQVTYETELHITGKHENTLWSMDRMKSTGGLLYRLREQNIVEGSETVIVEEEDPFTGTRYTIRELVPGKDYTLDYLTGNLWLFTPVEIAGPPQTVIREGTSFGDRPRYIVVSYRFIPTQALSIYGHGETLIQRFDYGDVGIHYDESVEEGRRRDGILFTTLRPTTDSVFHLEAGRRFGYTQKVGFSTDGGLQYTVSESTLLPPKNAFLSTGRFTLGTIEWDLSFRHLQGGYQPLRYLTSTTQTTIGVGARYPLGERSHIAIREDRQWEEDRSLSHKEWGQVRYPLGSFFLTHEVALKTSSTDRLIRRGDLGSGAEYPVNETITVYGSHQHEVYRKGEIGEPRFYRSTIGSLLKITEEFRTFTEGFRSVRTYGGRVGGEYSQGEKGVRVSYGVERDRWSPSTVGVFSTYGSTPISSTFRVSAGEEIRHLHREVGNATLLGGEYTPYSFLSFGFSGERGEYPEPGGLRRRGVARLKIRGSFLGWQGAGMGGYRFQKDSYGWIIGRDGEGEITFPPQGDFSHRVGFRYAFDYDVTRAEPSSRYQEIYGGSAYRPKDTDRLQVLSMVRYAREILPPRLDISRTEIFAMIFSLDSTYRLTSRWDIGGKISGKRSGVRWEGFLSDPIYTYLFIARTSVILYSPLDLAGEYRLYLQPQNRITLHGPAVEVGVRPEKWVRFSIGWQFTRFEDELMPHDRMDAEGIYVRVMGIW